jgi:hypothetical protein
MLFANIGHASANSMLLTDLDLNGNFCPAEKGSALCLSAKVDRDENGA